jgi:hypothetical protein
LVVNGPRPREVSLMGQLPDVEPPTAHDAPTGLMGPDGQRRAADGRLERYSRVMLQLGAALVAIIVVLPGLGAAALLLYVASMETVVSHPMAPEDRLLVLSVAALVVGFVVACAVVLRRSLRRGWFALAIVGIGGLACIYSGVRGIIEATGVDGTITALSWAVASTGAVLVSGASLGMASRMRTIDHPAPG